MKTIRKKLRKHIHAVFGFGLIVLIIGGITLTFYNKLSSDSSFLNSLKVLGGFFALWIAYWRWEILDQKSKDENYIKAMELLKDDASQAAYVGAAYSLSRIVENDPEYLLPTLAAIESAIRDLSDKSLKRWMEQSLSKDSGPIGDRIRTPAIAEMIRIVLELRFKAKNKEITIPELDFSFVDLRGKEMLSIYQNNDYLDLLSNANLRHADLRHISLITLKKAVERGSNEDNNIEQAWIALKKEKLVKKIIESGEFGQDWKTATLLMKSKNVRLFLRGDWSHLSENLPAKKRNKFRTIFQKSKYHEVDNINIRISGGIGTRFDDMNMDDCDFYTAKMVKASFIGTSLINANFMLADLRESNFKGANLDGANFVGADTSGVDFTKKQKRQAIGL